MAYFLTCGFTNSSIDQPSSAAPEGLIWSQNDDWPPSESHFRIKPWKHPDSSTLRRNGRSPAWLRASDRSGCRKADNIAAVSTKRTEQPSAISKSATTRTKAAADSSAIPPYAPGARVAPDALRTWFVPYAPGAFGALGAFGAPGTPGAFGAAGAPGAAGMPGAGAALAPQLGHSSALGSTSAPHWGHFTGPASTVGGLKHIDESPFLFLYRQARARSGRIPCN